MSDIGKEAISDISQIFQEYFDRIDQNFNVVKGYFKKLNEFLLTKDGEEEKYYAEKDMKSKFIKKGVYAYRRENQDKFNEMVSEISSRHDAIYEVIKDINLITKETPNPLSTPSSSTNVQGASEAPQQVIQVNTDKGSFWPKRKKTTNLPKSVEDAHIKSENLKEEILNIDKLFLKMVEYHNDGIDRQEIMGTLGMNHYLSNEYFYFNTVVLPQLSKIVRRANELLGKSHMKDLKEIYSSTLKTEENIEKAKIQGDQSNPKN